MTNFATLKLGHNFADIVVGQEPTRALGPFVQGATGPGWVVTVLTSVNAAINLTTATYAGVLYDPVTSTRKNCAGSYSTTTAASGIFTYAPAAGDSDTPGVWWWESKLTIGTEIYYVRIPVIYEERFAA